MTEATTPTIKTDRRYYDPSDILSLGATYNIVYGERGNGKTFAFCRKILEAYFDEGLPSAYIRRLDEMIKKGNLETLFNPHLEYIQERSGGKWNYVSYMDKKFTLQKRDPETNALIERDKEPFCRAYAISTNETTKGPDRGRVKYVFFDEFITRSFYLTNEVILFQNLLETIIRKRPGVIINMVANTVNKFCIYFKHMGLSRIKQQKQGTIDQYLLGKAQTKIACEYCLDDDSAASEVAEQYYCFDNPQAEMIKNGSWEFDLYRLIPKGLDSSSNPEFEFFVEFDDTITRGAVYIYQDSPVICFTPKTTPIKDRDNSIIYGQDISSPSPLHQIDLARAPTRAQEVILNLMKQHKTYFATNEDGENIQNWLKYATKGGLKV